MIMSIKSLKRKTDEALLWFCQIQVEIWGEQIGVYAGKRYAQDDGGDSILLPALIIDCPNAQPSRDMPIEGLGEVLLQMRLVRDPRAQVSEEDDDILGRMQAAILDPETAAQINEYMAPKGYHFYEAIETQEDTDYPGGVEDEDLLAMTIVCQHLYTGGLDQSLADSSA